MAVVLAVLVATVVVAAHAQSISPEPAGVSPLPEPASDGAKPHRLSTNAGGDSQWCASCHADIAEEWRASAHGGAWVDSYFQAARRVEATDWCRPCHAPEGDPLYSPSLSAQAEGVGCTTCHVAAGQVVSTSTSALGQQAHSELGDPRWATQSACGGCHQFLFPRSTGQVNPTAMQNTVVEWQSSRHAASPCQSCHMALVPNRAHGAASPSGTHRSHRFSARNPEMLGRAVRVAAIRQPQALGAPAEEVVVSLQSDGAGHAVPTGDIFRRLQVRIYADTPLMKWRLAAATVAFSRTFRDVRTHPEDPDNLTTQHIDGPDRRLRAPGSPGDRAEVHMTLNPGAGRLPVRWTLVYQRFDDGLAKLFGISPRRDEIVISEGVLPPLALPQ